MLGAIQVTRSSKLLPGMWETNVSVEFAFSSSSPAAPGTCVPLGCQAPAPLLPWLTTTAGRSEAMLALLLAVSLMLALPSVVSVKLDSAPVGTGALKLLLAK